MTERIVKTNFQGDPNLGLYGFATDEYCIVGNIGKVSFDNLGVPVIETTALGTDLVGLFLAGNSQKIIAPKLMMRHELRTIQKQGDVLVLDTRFTALGNLILLNDKACLVSRLLKRHVKDIERFFDMPVKEATVAGLPIIGSVAVCTNKGCLVHPKTSEQEVRVIEKTLGVDVDIGTVNFGSPFVHSGIVVNKNGVVVGDQTSGPELSRITEVFGFL